MTQRWGGWTPSVRLAMVGAVLVAYALRLHTLGEANLWWDEALAVWAARKSLVDMTLWTAADVHPPVYFWSLWVWMRLVGEAEGVVRWVSVAYGVMTVPLSAILAARVLRFVPRSARTERREVAGPGPRLSSRLPPWEIAALVTAGAVALSRFEVWWSMELRMYVAAGAFMTLAAYGATRWWTDTGRSLRWLGIYAAGAWLALHTIYLAGAGLVALNVGVFLAWLVVALGGLRTDADRHIAGDRLDRRLLAWAGAQVAVIVATLPWLAVAIPAMSSWRSGGEPATAEFVAQLWLTLLATGESTHLGAAVGATAVFWLGAGAGFAGLMVLAVRFGGRAGPGGQPEHRGHAGPRGGIGASAALLLAPFTVVPALAVWAATQPRSIFYSPVVEARYLVPFAPPVYALIGAGLAALVVAARRSGRSRESTGPTEGPTDVPRRAVPVILASLAGGAVLVSLVISLPRHYQGRVWNDAHLAVAATIWSQAEADDVVLLLSGNRYPMASYVYDRRSAPGALPSVWSLGSDAGVAAGETWQQNSQPRPEVRGTGGGRQAVSRSAYGAPRERPKLVPFPDEGGGPVNEQPWRERLEWILGEHDRVWLWSMEPHLQDPDGMVRQHLESLPVLLDEVYGPDRLTLFGPDAAEPRVHRAAGPRHWAGSATLEGERTVAVPVAEQGLNSVPAVVQASIDRVGGRAPAHVQVLYSDFDPAAARRENLVAPAVVRHVDVGLVLAALSPNVEVQGRTRYVLPEASRWPAGPANLVVSNTVLVEFEIAEGTPVTPQRPMPATIGGATLSSAGWSSSVRPGQNLVVDLIFSGRLDRGELDALQAAAATLFVHLLGPVKADGSVVWSIGDAPPPPGMWAFLATHPQEPFLSRHVLPVPAEAPPGRYQIEVGAYDPASVERFPVGGAPTSDSYAIDHQARRIVVGPVEIGH